MNRLKTQRRKSTARRGLTTPAVVIALLVMMAGLGLLLDRLWLEAARVELTTAAEAAALAAGRELVSDQRLQKNSDGEALQLVAKTEAARFARANRVAGQPLTLDVSAKGDVQFVRVVNDPLSGQEYRVPVEEDELPERVVVTAHRSRQRNTGISLFIGGLTGVSLGDAAARVEASWDNRIIGVEPFEGGPTPLIPIAIKAFPTGTEEVGNRDDWNTLIESELGADQYSVDSEGNVSVSSDGLPELKLVSEGRDGKKSKTNVRLLDLGNGFHAGRQRDQLRHGVTIEDLVEQGGKLEIGQGRSELIAARAKINGPIREFFEEIIGEPRLALLYDGTFSDNEGRCKCIGLVAVRVLHLEELTESRFGIVIQPTTIMTRTALLAEPHESDVSPNRYIYKVQVSR